MCIRDRYCGNGYGAAVVIQKGSFPPAEKVLDGVAWRYKNVRDNKSDDEGIEQRYNMFYKSHNISEVVEGLINRDESNREYKWA